MVWMECVELLWLCFMSILLFAIESISILCYALCKSTVGLPLSWCPFTWWRETWHCILANKLQLVLSRSECATKRSMVLWVWSPSNTNFPLHATVSVPVGLRVDLRQCHMARRSLYTPAALLLKELWLPAVLGVIIEPIILLVVVLPSMIHVHALWSCWYDPLEMANAILAFRASRKLSSEPIYWRERVARFVKIQTEWATLAMLLMWLLRWVLPTHQYGLRLVYFPVPPQKPLGEQTHLELHLSLNPLCGMPGYVIFSGRSCAAPILWWILDMVVGDWVICLETRLFRIAILLVLGFGPGTMHRSCVCSQ